jgi:peptidoglycan/xylan/chitin deacetylase (PgdA/CDA1 family)
MRNSDPKKRIWVLLGGLWICLSLARPSVPPTHRAFVWPEGKRAAISLTFDDARLSQVDMGLPILDEYGVKATFYVNPDGLKERLEGWRKAVKNGHEIGNHTMTHPCTGNYSFSKDNALEDMTLKDIRREIVGEDRVLLDLLGVKPVSFAYPCCQAFVGRGRKVESYVPMVAESFLTGRMGGNDAGNDPLVCDLSQLLAGGSDDVSFERLRPLIDQAAAEGRWLILCGHEVGAGGFQITRSETLEAICCYAADPKNGLWIDTVGRIGKYVSDHRPR